MRKIKIGFALIGVLVALVAAGYVGYYRLYYEWAIDWGFMQPTAQFCPFASEESAFSERLIAHGSGVIGHKTQTDSKEALLQAIDNGFRFIEVDLRKTLDGHYFAAHRYNEFNDMTGHAGLRFLPPTAQGVRERKIFGRYTPLLLTDIAEILKGHPAVVLVVDKARDFDLLIEEFPYPEQMIVEVSSLGQYYAALAAGIRYPAFNKLNVPKIDRYDVAILITDKNHLAANLATYRDYINENHCLMVTGFPTGTSVTSELRSMPKTLFYVDSH